MFSLKDKKIAIWGLGKEGHSLLDFLSKKYPSQKIEILDDETADKITDFDVVFKSPGVSLYHPLIQKAKRAGVLISSGVNLYLSLKPKETKVIAITGTKGKSTTSALLTHTLKSLGKKAEIGGNFGVPAIEFVDKTPEFLVMETSSYQAADLTGDLERALVLNLYPEHKNWHLTHEQYFLDKLHILENVSDKTHAFLNAMDEKTLSLVKDKEGYSFFNSKEGFHIEEGFFMKANQPIFKTSSLALKGDHNQIDALAVLALVDSLGMNPSLCEQAFQSFESLPHRMACVLKNEKYCCYDDSISTIPETALAALKTLQSLQKPTVLIAGGFDRGPDFEKLADYLVKEQVFCVALPDTGVRLLKALKEKGGKGILASDMKEAVSKAFDFLPKGGVILLSPASPSYNVYKNYEEKGDDFKRQVLEYLSLKK